MVEIICVTLQTSVVTIVKNRSPLSLKAMFDSPEKEQMLSMMFQEGK